MTTLFADGLEVPDDVEGWVAEFTPQEASDERDRLHDTIADAALTVCELRQDLAVAIRGGTDEATQRNLDELTTAADEEQSFLEALCRVYRALDTRAQPHLDAVCHARLEEIDRVIEDYIAQGATSPRATTLNTMTPPSDDTTPPPAESPAVTSLATLRAARDVLLGALSSKALPTLEELQTLRSISDEVRARAVTGADPDALSVLLFRMRRLQSERERRIALVRRGSGVETTATEDSKAPA
jgi:hypothetical protein